ncbi:hypothetical protein J3F84DRAFT_389702 [Trichoderma pleuroticola]
MSGASAANTTYIPLVASRRRRCQFAPSRRKAFVFTEYLKKVNFKAHSRGNGRFIQGPPSPDLEICFKLCKIESSLDIYILEETLIHWLRAIPSLHDHIGNDFFGPVISMDLLLPHYPELSAKFEQDRGEEHSFDSLDLFFRHFLQQGSVFATFGLEHLHKRGILTDVHLRDILSQNRPMSEDLDLLDKAVDKIDERDIKGPNKPLRFVDEPFQSQLLAATRRREAQERRTMAHRVIVAVANSRKKLLNARITQDPSAKFMAFLDQVGTAKSIWGSGIRAILHIYKGYKPRSLSDIVSALQIADAMRSVVPPSRRGSSKKQFTDDIPRWASLLRPDDQHLFFEIASHLWGIPASTVAHEMANSSTHPLIPLRGIVERLVRTFGLSDHGSGNSHRLQTSRQYLFDTRHTFTYERPTLTERGPLPGQGVQENLPTSAPKSPDPEDCSPSVSSHLTAPSPATTISPSSMTTAMPGLATVGTLINGTISCEHCDSKFKLGKNGRRGQASNLQKHMKIHHPETIPDYHRVIYDCRYGCGTRDPNKSNIKAHENKHCAKRKGKQPRCHGKWRQTIT